MEKYTRNLEKELELMDELVDEFDFEYVKVLNDALCEYSGYDYLKDSAHDPKEMRKNVRKQLRKCLDNLAECKYWEGYIDDNGKEHYYFTSSIRGQFETVVTYDPEDNSYGGHIKYINLESSTF